MIMYMKFLTCVAK